MSKRNVEDNAFRVVGIEFRTSKKTNKSYKMLHLSRPFTDTKYGIGARTSVEYCSDKNYPDELKVGDFVTLTYDRGFNGQAFVNGVYIVELDQIPTIEVKK